MALEEKFQTHTNLTYYHTGLNRKKRLIFLHGIWMPPGAYQAIFQINSHEVIAPYFIGNRDLINSHLHTYDQVRALCNQFIDQFEKENPSKPTTLVGHSAGGLLAIDMADRDNVESVIAINPALNSSTKLGNFFENNTKMVLNTNPFSLRHIPFFDLIRFSGNLLHGFTHQSLIKTYAETEIEILNKDKIKVLYNDSDELISADSFERSYAKLGNRLIRLDTKGHGWPIFQPEEFSKIMLTHLAS